VHFDPATKREDELLLSFVDYGMVSTTMTGVYVQSLQLPLHKARNIYEETPRYTSIKDVAGFTNINAKAQPWCALLKPTLQRQLMCDEMNVYCPLDIITMMKTSLRARLKLVHKIAADEFDQTVQDMARQDARAAQKAKARLESRLDATMKFLDELPPENYDRQLSQRILKVSETTDGAEWLNTPLRQTMRSGGAKLVSTIRRTVRVVLEPAPAPVITEAAEGAGDGVESGEFEESEDDVHVEDTDATQPQPQPAESESAPRSKRARTAPTRLDTEMNATSGRGRGRGKKMKGVEEVCMCVCCRL